MSEPSSPNPNLESLSRVQILIAMGVTAVVLLLIARLWLVLDASADMLSVQWSSQAVLIGWGVGLGITAASSLLYRLWAAYRQSADYYLELVITPLALPDLIWLGLLPGLSEELLFRGVMLPAIGLTWFGLAISSLCFGILHFSGSQHWSYVVWASVIGAVLGLSAIYSGNLLVPIVAHITTNLVSSSLWKLRS
ncbi:MAG: CPBP family intramembrane metalloprotease [Elainella sp. Prado103]|nr:CPBP family intramembrane metalloprotease [Elainella sp. Prado103]